MKEYSWEWVTNEMFDRTLEEVVAEMSAGEILQTPGIYEVLAEELINTVLDRLKDQRFNDDD